MGLRLGQGERVGLKVDSVNSDDSVAFLGAFLGFRFGVKARLEGKGWVLSGSVDAVDSVDSVTFLKDNLMV